MSGTVSSFLKEDGKERRTESLGTSQVEREYEFVLTGTFLFVKNKSTYAPQEKNPKGEVHEDWGCSVVIA